MHWNKALLPTYKDDPAEAEVTSHKLMLRAGVIRQLSAGVYTFLPLGWRAMLKAMAIIREEMSAIGAQEIFMPALTPIEIWQESGRDVDMAEIMLRLKDRKGREFALAPTHEEIITDLSRDHIRSFRDLPQSWYQIQEKFRDEPRPRFGLLRVREFFMKDSYSFCANWEQLDDEYRKHDAAYRRIFTRCGLKFVVVGASSGLMGGRQSQEFMVPSDAGEDMTAFCDNCHYTANVEVAESIAHDVELLTDLGEKRRISTPNLRTVEEVSAFLNLNPAQMLKSLVYVARDSGEMFMILLRGDSQLCEEKLQIFTGKQVRAAQPEEVENVFGAPVGFLGPINAPASVKIFADKAFAPTTPFATGANEKDFHVMGYTLNDIRVDAYGDFRLVANGEKCTVCGKPLTVAPTIEIGHIFKLGTKYSQALRANFTDSDGAEKPIIMGSYGIGVGRILSSAVELHADTDGIVWPITIAPFEIVVTAVDVTKPEVMSVAENIYNELRAKNIDVLFDDRDLRAGFKFKDAELIGIPLRVVVGKRVNEGFVELVVRATKEKIDVHIDEVVTKLCEIRTRMFAELNP